MLMTHTGYLSEIKFIINIENLVYFLEISRFLFFLKIRIGSAGFMLDMAATG